MTRSTRQKTKTEKRSAKKKKRLYPMAGRGVFVIQKLKTNKLIS